MNGDLGCARVGLCLPAGEVLVGARKAAHGGWTVGNVRDLVRQPYIGAYETRLVGADVRLSHEVADVPDGPAAVRRLARTDEHLSRRQTQADARAAQVAIHHEPDALQTAPA